MKNIILLILAASILLSCGEKKDQQETNTSQKLKVAVVNYPLNYFTKRISNNIVDVVYPVPGDIDPAYWEPKPQQVVLYQNADLIILNGADYAKWIKKVSLPKTKIINSSLAIKDNYIKLKAGVTHSHGPKGKHEHEGFAFTTWLYFKYAIMQAESVKNALIKLLPDSKDKFEKNFSSLKDDLENLDEQMTKISSRISKPLIASHPVYQYLAEGYNINIIIVHWEPTDMPDEMEWEKFDKMLKENPTNIMIWEDEPLPKVKQKLLERGIQIVVFNPGANTPANGDFLELMKTNIANLGEI